MTQTISGNNVNVIKERKKNNNMLSEKVQNLIEKSAK